VKIIHTADWHLGKMLNKVDLIEHQQTMLEQFIHAMEEERPDVIVIAGDIYDKVNPSNVALNLFEQTIERLNQDGDVPIVIISGNHDSKEKLSFAKYWMEKQNIHIKTTYEDVFSPVEIKGMKFFCMPYFSPHYMRSKEHDVESHYDVYRVLVDELNHQELINDDHVNFCVGHLFVQGGMESESEKDIQQGNLELVHASLFKDFDQVLLGHLHSPFSLEDQRFQHIHYSGSLLKYSFDEEKQPKGYRVISIDDDGNTSSKFKGLQDPFALKVYRGSIFDILNKEVEFDPDTYLKFELTEVKEVNNAYYKLRNMYPNLLEIKPVLEQSVLITEQGEVNIERSDEDIVKQFYEFVEGESFTELQQQYVFEKIRGIEDDETNSLNR